MSISQFFHLFTDVCLPIFVSVGLGWALDRRFRLHLESLVKLNIYLTDLANFAKVNETMAKYFSQPFPARAAIGVKELPRGALVEADAVLVLG